MSENEQESEGKFRKFFASNNILILAGVISALTTGTALAGSFLSLDVARNRTLGTPRETNLDPVWPTVFLLGAIVLGVAVASLIFSVVQLRARRATLKEIQKMEEALIDDALDLKKIWAVTQKRLDYYHTIATAQARQSFLSTQISTGAGFLLIVVVGWIASQADTVVGTISAGAVGVVGGGLSAYIGATFMKTQSAATAQLRQFFLQPVEHSRLLGAERLITLLEGDQKAAAVQEVIKAMMASPTEREEKSEA